MDEPRAALQEALEAIPASIRALAREADVSPRLLRLIRDGRRRLTPEARDAVAEALRRWEADCREAAESLEAANLDSNQEGDDA